MHKNIAIATALGLSLGYSTTAAAGLVFTQVSTTNGEPSAVTKITTDGENGKAETIESAVENPFMPPGSYMLFTTSDMYLVNPAMRTFARFDTSMFAGAAGMAGQMEIKDASVEKVVDEPGERISGYATRHYQFKSSWTMAMKGMPMSTETSVVEDVWTTTAIDVPAMPVGAEGGLPPAVAGQVTIDGFPLRRVTKQSTKMNMGAMPGLGALGGRLANRVAGAGGGGDATTTTMEVRDIEQIDVAASTFEVPDGYSETQLFQAGPALPSLNGVQEQPPAVPSLNNLDK